MTEPVRTCTVCHGPILRKSERAKFCSDHCKERFHVARRIAKREGRS